MKQGSLLRRGIGLLMLATLGIAVLTGFATPASALSPPSLTATPGCGVAYLSWTASSGATSYNVKRRPSMSVTWTTIASVTSTTYTNTGLTNGTTYCYEVTAVNAAGESAPSNVVCVTPGCPPPPPSLTATAGCGKVILTWTASSGATSYNVKRSLTSGGPYSLLANVASTTYTDTMVVNGTTYYYVVSAVNAAGESANSNQASATPHCP